MCKGLLALRGFCIVALMVEHSTCSEEVMILNLSQVLCSFIYWAARLDIALQEHFVLALYNFVNQVRQVLDQVSLDCKYRVNITLNLC